MFPNQKRRSTPISWFLSAVTAGIPITRDRNIPYSRFVQMLRHTEPQTAHEYAPWGYQEQETHRHHKEVLKERSIGEQYCDARISGHEGRDGAFERMSPPKRRMYIYKQRKNPIKRWKVWRNSVCRNGNPTVMEIPVKEAGIVRVAVFLPILLQTKDLHAGGLHILVRCNN